MLRDIIRKELLDTFTSPRFVVIFSACSVLVLFSIFTGTRDYETNNRQFEVATSVMRDTVASQVSYQALGVWGNYKLYKKPAPLSALVQGLESNLGRSTVMSLFETPKLRDTRLNDEPVYAIFGTLDLFFIVNLVLSLFAIVFTFDAISGERERGTLKLMLSGPVPRDSVVLGKLIGTFVGLILPLLLPLTFGILLMTLMPDVELVGADWGRLAALIALTLLYVTVFLSLGLFVSSRSRRSSTSFLVLLVIWVIVVWVIPRAAVMVAAEAVPVPEVAEVEAKRGAIDRQWYRESVAEQERWVREHPGETSVPIETQGEINGRLQKKAAEEKRRVDEDHQASQRKRRNLALALARLSPTAAFTHAAMAISQTDIERQERFLAATKEYQRQFQIYVSDKMKAERRAQVLGQDTGDGTGIDISDMPVFQFEEEQLGNTFERVWIDLALLALASLLLFAGAFISFLRYDVR